MQKSIIVVCILLCHLLFATSTTGTNTCSEIIDLDRIDALIIIDNHFISLTGSGTMPGTGSGTMSPCTGSGSISGSIFTQYHEPVKGVKVELNSTQDNYPFSYTTGTDGEYAFNPVENEYNYLITPHKEGDHLNGISTIDVLLLANVVFRPNINISPYTRIASDVNQDQVLNIRDVVELLYLIIGKRTELDESWVFVDADQQFIDESNPWPYADEITVNNLDGDSVDNDFIGIKVGDLSGDANPWMTPISQKRNSNVAELFVDDAYLEKDVISTINFYSKDLEDIKGMQLFLAHSGLEIINLHSGILDAEKAELHLSDQTLSIAWYGIADAHSESLFSMDVRSTNEGFLSDILSQYNNWLPSEAYLSEDLLIKATDLKFSSSHSKDFGFTLKQNFPNPFTAFTDISYTLAEAGDVHLDVYDNTGRLHFQKTQQAQTGKNTMRINRGDLENIGLYYYTLTHKGKTQTKSLLLID